MLISDAIKQFDKWRAFKVKKATVRGYSLTLKHLCIFMRNCHVETISLEDIILWFELHRNLEYDQNSFVGKAMALRKFFEFLTKKGIKVLNPDLISVPTKEYKLPKVLEEGNYQKLLSVIPDNNDPRHIRNKAMIKLFWDTGMRAGEMLALDVPDMDLLNKRAIIKTEKSRGMRPFREVFWTDETNNQLKLWLKKRTHLKDKHVFNEPDALFTSTHTSKAGSRLLKSGLCEMLRRYSERAKLPYVNSHSFRHHKGHTIIQKGGSSSDVMNILGHATLSSSSIYTMMRGKELEERARKYL